MMKLTSRYLHSFAAAIFLFAGNAVAQNAWNLPVSVSQSNAEVRFEIESTWHTVEGKVHKIEGRVWLENPADPNSVRAELEFPVASFDTDSSMRDSEMRDVMAEPKFPKVKLTVQRVEGLCAPDSLVDGATCPATLVSALDIRGVSKDMRIPVVVRRTTSGFVVSGEAHFQWDEFGVEDPSIFVAKLDKAMKVIFSLTLPKS